MTVFGLFSHFGDELQPEQSEETWCAAALAWASQPAVAHAAEHLEALDPSCLPSMQRRGTKEITAITRLFPWVMRSTFLQDVHKVCCWLEKLKQKHQAGNACMALIWTHQTNPHKSIFRSGLFSSSHPLPHRSPCKSHKHPNLERLKENMCLYQACLRLLFSPIQTALAFFLLLQLVSATGEHKTS